MAAVTICSDFGVQKNKVWHCFHCFPIYLHEVMGPDAMILVFWMLSFKPTFSFSSFTFFKRLFSSSSLSALRVASSAYLFHQKISGRQDFVNICTRSSDRHWSGGIRAVKERKVGWLTRGLYVRKNVIQRQDGCRSIPSNIGRMFQSCWADKE